MVASVKRANRLETLYQIDAFVVVVLGSCRETRASGRFKSGVGVVAWVDGVTSSIRRGVILAIAAGSLVPSACFVHLPRQDVVDVLLRGDRAARLLLLLGVLGLVLVGVDFACGVWARGLGFGSSGGFAARSRHLAQSLGYGGRGAAQGGTSFESVAGAAGARGAAGGHDRAVSGSGCSVGGRAGDGFGVVVFGGCGGGVRFGRLRALFEPGKGRFEWAEVVGLEGSTANQAVHFPEGCWAAELDEVAPPCTLR